MVHTRISCAIYLSLP